jgi:hypothetical protein
MAQEKFCQDCSERHNCQKVYQQLGDNTGPSVVVKVIFAFFLPPVVFIASLAAFEEIFAAAINTWRIQTALSFLLALLVTFLCISIIGVVNKQLNHSG